MYLYAITNIENVYILCSINFGWYHNHQNLWFTYFKELILKWSSETRIVYLWSSSLTSCKYILLNTAVFLNYQNHILGQANELVLFSTKPADMIKIFCLLLEFKAYMNSSTVLDSVKVQIRHLSLILLHYIWQCMAHRQWWFHH